MKEQVLVIYEKEEEYAIRLSGYLNRNPEFPYQVAVFTNPDSLQGYLQRGQADVLLLGEALQYEVPSCKKISLREKREEDCEEPWIFKYQSAGNIMREIIAYAALPETGERGNGPLIYLVFAPKAGCERSAYTHQLIRDLQREKEVLYLNMELFPSSFEEEDSAGKGMSEAVYYLKQNSEQVLWKVRSLITEENGIRMIRPVHCSMDLLELTVEDAKTLMDLLQKMQDYQAIVMEVGFYNETMLELCRHSDHICVVSGRDDTVGCSPHFFLNQLSLMQQEGVKRKVELVQYGGTGEKTEFKDGAPGTVGFFT